MQIVKEIYLDFYQSEPVLVTAKRDINTRFIKVTLLDNGNLFSVPSGVTANIARGAIWNTCTVNDDGTILAPITADMIPGKCPAEIELYQGTDKLTSWNFILEIQPSARDDTAIEGTNKYSELENLIEEVQGIADDVGNANITFTQATTRTNLLSGDSIKTAFGKIAKWFTDLGAAAFQAVANNLTTESSGSVLDARQGKSLSERIGELNALATSDKSSVVNAINELNSKSYLLYGGTSIPSGADMNDYNTPGNYYCKNNATAQTLKNAPFNGSAFILKIEYALGTYRERQIYTRYSTNQKAVRYYNGSAWSPYVYFSDDATVMNEITSYVPTMTESNSDITIGDVAYAYVYKFGRICSIQFNVKGSINTANKFITLFTLNEGYRPNQNIQHNYISQNGVAMILNIVLSSGEVQIYCIDGTITNDWIIRQCLTFACDS